MTLEFWPVRVAAGSDDQEGVLAFANEQLVAVLVRLSKLHDRMAGSWFLEATFGIRDAHRVFPDLETAQQWLSSMIRQPNQHRDDQG